MPETKEKYHHVPVANKKKGNPIRTIDIGKGIKALYDTKRKRVVTYLFDITKYTMKEAKRWAEQHKGSLELSQIVHNRYLAGLYEEARKNDVKNILEKLNY